MTSAPDDAGTFIFAGGGSGGHISPGLAIAERLREISPTSRALFLCSDRRVDRDMLSEANERFEALPGSPFSMRPRGLARFASSFYRSRRAAEEVMARERVCGVVALGGFVAAPVVSAAVRRGVPVTLVNLDAPPGKANRWIAGRCRQVVSAIEVKKPASFAQRVVGMPIRRNALAPCSRRECRRRLALDPGCHTLLVTGASQGAQTINELLAALVNLDPVPFEGWQVFHLCGQCDSLLLRETYAAAGIAARVEPFVHQMGLAWGAADLAVSRAGASSVAEAWRNAVPTVFLPYPFHRDRHQEHNARPMAATGGAVIEVDHIETDENVAAAGETLRRLLRDGPRRRTMHECLRARPAPDSAATIARLLLQQEGTEARRHGGT